MELWPKIPGTLDLLSQLCVRHQCGPFSCFIYLGQLFEVLMFHFKGEETEASKWQNHSFSPGVSCSKIIMLFFFPLSLLLPTRQAGVSAKRSRRGKRKHSSLLIPLGSSLSLGGSLVFTLLLLELV